MVYKLEETDCELTFVDWTKKRFSPIPSAQYPENGLYNNPEEIKVTVGCDCGEAEKNIQA